MQKKRRNQPNLRLTDSFLMNFGIIGILLMLSLLFRYYLCSSDIIFPLLIPSVFTTKLYACFVPLLLHIGKPLHCLGKVLYGFVCITVLDPIPDTVLDMPL